MSVPVHAAELVGQAVFLVLERVSWVVLGVVQPASPVVGQVVELAGAGLELVPQAALVVPRVSAAPLGLQVPVLGWRACPSRGVPVPFLVPP